MENCTYHLMVSKTTCKMCKIYLAPKLNGCANSVVKSVTAWIAWRFTYEHIEFNWGIGEGERTWDKWGGHAQNRENSHYIYMGGGLCVYTYKCIYTYILIYIYIYIYIYMCVYMYVYIHMFAYIYIYLCESIYACACIYIYIYIYIYVCVCAWIYIYVWIYMCVCIYIYIYIYPCEYIRIYMYVWVIYI